MGERGAQCQNIGTFCRELCKNGSTDRFAIWVVDSGGSKEAQVQLYSPDGAIGATWRIRLNRPSAAAMRPHVKLLWPLVCLTTTVGHCLTDTVSGTTPRWPGILQLILCYRSCRFPASLPVIPTTLSKCCLVHIHSQNNVNTSCIPLTLNYAQISLTDYVATEIYATHCIIHQNKNCSEIKTWYASYRNSQLSRVCVFDSDNAYVDNRTVVSSADVDSPPLVKHAVN